MSRNETGGVAHCGWYTWESAEIRFRFYPIPVLIPLYMYAHSWLLNPILTINISQSKVDTMSPLYSCYRPRKPMQQSSQGHVSIDLSLWIQSGDCLHPYPVSLVYPTSALYTQKQSAILSGKSRLCINNQKIERPSEPSFGKSSETKGP